jgi:hypothetical protein
MLSSWSAISMLRLASTSSASAFVTKTVKQQEEQGD